MKINKQPAKIVIPEAVQSSMTLIEVDVGDLKAPARPYHRDDVTVHYATSCPHCGQGIFFVQEDLYDDCIACPHCKARSKRMPPLIEPFENPFIDPIAQLLIPNLVQETPSINSLADEKAQALKLTPRKKITVLNPDVPEGD
jgi:hypothetical protein